MQSYASYETTSLIGRKHPLKKHILGLVDIKATLCSNIISGHMAAAYCKKVHASDPGVKHDELHLLWGKVVLQDMPVFQHSIISASFVTPVDLYAPMLSEMVLLNKVALSRSNCKYSSRCNVKMKQYIFFPFIHLF